MIIPHHYKLILRTTIVLAVVCLFVQCALNSILYSFPGTRDLSDTDPWVSLHFGKSYMQGFYRDYLTDSYITGIGLIYPLRFLNKDIHGEAEFTGGRRKLRESEESTFDLYTLRAGLLYSYPLFNLFQPYAGLYMQESYLKITADKIGEEETSYKPGAAVKAGLFWSLHRDVSLRTGFDYSLMPLSGEKLESWSLSAAVIVRVPISGTIDKRISSILKTGTVDDNEKRVDLLYQRALSETEKGDIDTAENSFREVLALRPDHEGAVGMMKEIGTAKEEYSAAKELISRKKYYDAIPLLEKSRTIILDADRDLTDARLVLSTEVPDLEQKGITAYEIRDYDRCISLMRKLQLIDPENETVRLYLPRAQSRKKAIDRLK